jgi:uncharacterized protein (DUF2252 family)
VIRFDAPALARSQLRRDREATRRYPELHLRKIARMSASPFAFLRGSAPLFYEMLQRRPALADGPGGGGRIVGDLHLENFGAYRPMDPAFASNARSSAQAFEATFGLNDFDDATIGPWRFDLLRITTSLILAGREMGATGVEVLTMADALLDAWNAHTHARKSLKCPPAPEPVAALIEQVARRTRREFLDARTEVVGGQRRFVRGPRYHELPRSALRRVPAAVERYLESLDEAERPEADRMKVLDATFRVAGTGSLGALRIAVLVEGKGGVDGGWIFDMKEQGRPSSHMLLEPPRRNGAKRVRLALAACLAAPPRMVGVTRLDGIPMLVRRLSPQEDKLDLAHLDHRQLPGLAHYLGALVGGAHRRGVTRPGRHWKPGDKQGLIDRAIGLAGLHEAVYLAYCDVTRRG